MDFTYVHVTHMFRVQLAHNAVADIASVVLNVCSSPLWMHFTIGVQKCLGLMRQTVRY